MRRLCTLLLAALLGGCAVAPYRPVLPAEFARSHRVYDLTFGWNTTVVDGRLQVDGYARNSRYFLLRDLTVTVSLIGADGTVRGSDRVFARPSELRQDELASFALILPAVPRPGDRLRFDYSYRASEDNDDPFFWLNSFEQPALGE